VVEEIQAEWARALGGDELAHLLRLLRRLAAIIDQPAGVAGPPRTGSDGGVR